MRDTIPATGGEPRRGPRPVRRPDLLAPHPRGAGRGGRSGHHVPAGHPQLRDLPRQDGGRRRQLVHEALDRGLRLLPQRRELHDGREPRGRPRHRRHVRDLPPARRATSSGTPASRTPTSFRSTRPSSRATRPRSSRSRTPAPARRSRVTFQLKNGDGSFVDPGVYKVSANGSLSIKLGGPTSDYTNAGMLANGQPFSESRHGGHAGHVQRRRRASRPTRSRTRSRPRPRARTSSRSRRAARSR